VALGILSNTPDSDTGGMGSTAAMSARLTVGVTVLLMCIPVVYLFVRNRGVAGAVVTALAICTAVVTLYAV